MLMVTMKLAMIICKSSIAGSVPLFPFGVYALETVTKIKQYPLLCFCSLCCSVSRILPSNGNCTTSSTTIRTTTTTESYDGGPEDVDDEDYTRKLEIGEVGCSLEGGWGGRP